MSLKDTTERFGTMTRVLHWGMAALLLWQYAGMISKVSLGRDAALTGLLAGNHAQVGTILFVLILIRLIWAVVNRGSRPAGAPGPLHIAAKAGQGILYLLMLLVPSAALLRAWGGERAFAPFGFEIFAARPEADVVTWAVEFAGAVHGEAAWLMLALVIGHIAMAFYHQFALRDGSITRMTH